MAGLVVPGSVHLRKEPRPVAEISLYLSSLAKYLAASPAQAGVVANRLAVQAGTEYDPRTDFWKAMRPALVNDRRTSRDGQAVWAAAVNATARRKGPYAAVARGWEQIIDRWDGGECVPLHTVEVEVGGLVVKIPSGFAERHPDGELEVVYTHLNTAPLPDPLPEAVMRVLQRRHPDASITYVDAHRPKQVRSSRDGDLARYDAWLDQAGMYLAHVLARQAAA